MSPTDATTPEQLFGDAVGDKRMLRRAYARLIKAHPPEEDAERFAHIRRLYEQAVADLARPRAHTVIQDDTADVGALLDAATPETWRQTVAALEALAGKGDLAAVRAAYGLLSAFAPEEAVPLLQRHLDAPGAAAHAVALLRATWRPLPGRSRDPAVQALIEVLPEAPSLELRASRLEVLCGFHPARAARLWQDDLGPLSTDPDLLARVLMEVLPDIRWYLDEAESQRALDACDDVRLPLEDAAVDYLRLLVFAARAVRALQAPELHPAGRAVFDGHRRDRGLQALALRDMALAVDDPHALFERLDRDHPGVSAALLDMFDMIGHTDQMLLRMAAEREPPDPHDRSRSRLVSEVKACIDEVNADPEVPRPDAGPWTRAVLDSATVGILIGAFPVAVGATIPQLAQPGASSPFIVAATWLLFAGVAIGLTLPRYRRWRRRKMQALLPWPESSDPDHDGPILDAVLRRAAARGWWPLEVGIALELLHGRGLAAQLPDPTDPALLLGLMHDAHVHRVMAWDLELQRLREEGTKTTDEPVEEDA